MDAKTWAEFVKNIVESLGVIVGGGGYFLYRTVRGSFTSNLSLSINCSRKTIPETGFDFLAVTAELAKGDRYSVELHDAKVRVSWPGSEPPKPVTKPLVGVHRRSLRREQIKMDGGKERLTQPASIIFHKASRDAPVLVLTPGEKMSFSQCFDGIPSATACTVEVVVLGKRWYNRRYRLLRWLADWSPESKLHPQWSASTISLPEPAERDRQPGASEVARGEGVAVVIVPYGAPESKG